MRYAFPAATTLIVLWGSHALHRFVGDLVPYLLLFPVVTFSAFYFGIGPSLWDLVLALAGTEFWIVSSARSFGASDTTQSLGAGAFLLGSIAVIAMAEVRRRHNDKLQKGQAELEDRVKERTAELDKANESLRELTARLLQLQDDERRRIARELHDSVGQLLSALNMNLSTVRTDIERLTKTAAALADSEGLVEEMSKEVRTISHLLHPPLLDEAGLASAVRWYIEGFAQRSGIQVDLDFPEDFGRLSREVETAIFRFMQECLTNIHRHSGSSIAKVHLRSVDGHVLVAVEDKGKGFSAQTHGEIASGGAGIGIRGMKERVRQLGGDLEITSNASGTTVRARLPVREGCRVADASTAA